MLCCKKAQRAGAKFTLSQIARIADYVTEDGALLMLHNLQNGLALATQNDVCEIVKNVVYEAFCNELTQMALDTGIRFDPNNIIAMNGCVDIAVLNMMVDTCPIQFKRTRTKSTSPSLRSLRQARSSMDGSAVWERVFV